MHRQIEMDNSLLTIISKDLLLPIDKLEYLIRSAPYRYKVYKIAKRSGKGKRIIAQPAREVKRLQYWVMKNIFPYFPVHEAAIAYRNGYSILNNAQPHAKNPYILKLDFKDFFPSIKGNDFLCFLNDAKDLKFGIDNFEYLKRILFRCSNRQNDLELSIGAPSSPSLSNIIMN